MPRASSSRLAIAALLASVAGPAWAGCTISTTSVAFGNYSPSSGAALDGIGGVNTVCDNNATQNVTVTINGGGSGNVNARRMTSGASTLSYQLYSDANRTVIWGSTAATGLTYRGRGRTESRPIYGRIPGGQNVSAGTYADTLTVTVTF